MLKVAFIIFGNLLFLYVFWKKLKEDYTAEIIFSTAFYMLAAMIFAYIAAYEFAPTSWFWLGLFGLSTGLLIGIYRNKLRVMETVEAAILSSLPGLSLILFADAIINKSRHSFFYGGIVVLFIVLFFLLDKHYTRFSWYKSGRIGFSGLTVLGLFFLLRAIVAVRFPFVLSFFGKHEVFMSAISAFFSFLGVFSLARQKT